MTIKWGGAAVTVLLVVVWIGSGWCDRVQTKFGAWVGVRHGRLVAGNWTFVYEPVLRDPTVQGANLVTASGVIDGRKLLFGVDKLNASLISPEPASVRLLFRGFAWHQSQEEWTIALPLWAPVMFAAVLTALTFRLDARARRRARLNLCPKCHYDRTGLAAGAVCPECGAASSTSPPAIP